MTLLITEIHQGEFTPTIAFAADRRISSLDGGGHLSSKETKVVPVSALNAALGFYGLATVSGRSMSVFLREFVSKATAQLTMRDFADKLAEALSAAIRDRYKHVRSGVHLAGFNSARQPEFRIIRNYDDEENVPPSGIYTSREEYQRRDVATLPARTGFSYHNGDLRSHAASWKALDASLLALRQAPDFLGTSSPEDHLEWIKFKMEVVVLFYRRFHPKPNIGGRIDALLLHPGEQHVHKTWRVEQHRRNPDARLHR